jgi:cbb3-type cytochrome oxidase subunit 3
MLDRCLDESLCDSTSRGPSAHCGMLLLAIEMLSVWLLVLLVLGFLGLVYSVVQCNKTGSQATARRSIRAAWRQTRVRGF